MLDRYHIYRLADELIQWEGEYHYPNGLLEKGGRAIKELLGEIEKLQDRIVDLGWQLSPDRMGK